MKRVSEAIQAKVNPEIGFDTDVNAAALAEFEYGRIIYIFIYIYFSNTQQKIKTE